MRSIGKRAVWGLLALSFSFGGHVLATDELAVLSCEDYDKIINFVQAEHLRLSLLSGDELLELKRSAIENMPEVMRDQSYAMTSMDFVRSDEAKTLKGKLSLSDSLCPHFSHPWYRAFFLKSFVSSLDPFSDFYLTNELTQRSSIVDGEFVGVGIGTHFEKDYVQVTEVVKKAPADGLLEVDDRIMQIDGRLVSQMTQREVRQRIRGERGTVVEFDVARGEERLTLSVTRDTVTQASVSHSMGEGGVLLIRIHRFYLQTAHQVREILMQHKDHTQGIILDLRDNPGGLLQAARDLVDLFVSSGVVVHLRGSFVRDELWAGSHRADLTTPMVVLVNERTASASEIVAGALQDYGRAILVGRPTYGKSSIQNVYDTRVALETDYKAHLKLTSLWYYLPSGRSVNLIEPDLVVGQALDHSVAEMPYQWPQRIQVPFFAQADQRPWPQPDQLNSDDGESVQLEELGEELIRRLMAASADDAR